MPQLPAAALRRGGSPMSPGDGVAIGSAWPPALHAEPSEPCPCGRLLPRPTQSLQSAAADAAIPPGGREPEPGGCGHGACPALAGDASFSQTSPGRRGVHALQEPCGPQPRDAAPAACSAGSDGRGRGTGAGAAHRPPSAEGIARVTRAPPRLDRNLPDRQQAPAPWASAGPDPSRALGGLAAGDCSTESHEAATAGQAPAAQPCMSAAATFPHVQGGSMCSRAVASAPSGNHWPATLTPGPAPETTLRLVPTGFDSDHGRTCGSGGLCSGGGGACGAEHDCHTTLMPSPRRRARLGDDVDVDEYSEVRQVCFPAHNAGAGCAGGSCLDPGGDLGIERHHARVGRPGSTCSFGASHTYAPRGSGTYAQRGRSPRCEATSACTRSFTPTRLGSGTDTSTDGEFYPPRSASPPCSADPPGTPAAPRDSAGCSVAGPAQQPMVEPRRRRSNSLAKVARLRMSMPLPTELSAPEQRRVQTPRGTKLPTQACNARHSAASYGPGTASQAYQDSLGSMSNWSTIPSAGDRTDGVTQASELSRAGPAGAAWAAVGKEHMLDELRAWRQYLRMCDAEAGFLERELTATAGSARGDAAAGSLAGAPAHDVDVLPGGVRPAAPVPRPASSGARTHRSGKLGRQSTPGAQRSARHRGGCGAEPGAAWR